MSPVVVKWHDPVGLGAVSVDTDFLRDPRVNAVWRDLARVNIPFDPREAAEFVARYFMLRGIAAVVVSGG